MKNDTKKQQGKVLIVLILIAAAMAIGIYFINANKAERRAAALAQSAQEEKDKRAKDEAIITAQRMAAQKQTDAYTTALIGVDGIMQRWYDAEQVASASSRISLAAPVAALQAIKREADAMTVPPCLDEAKPKLLLGMAGILDAYLTFMTHTGDIGKVLAGTKFDDARPHFIYFKDTRSACPAAAKS